MPLDLKLLKDGDAYEWERAWTELQLWHVAKSKVMFYLQAKFSHFVEDVTADALSQLVNKAIKRCRNVNGIVPLLKTIAKHEAIDFTRSFRAKKVDELPKGSVDELPEDYDMKDLESEAEMQLLERLKLDGDLMTILGRLVEGAGLNALEEAIFREHIVAGCTQQEFASSHGVPLGTVGRVARRIIEKIKGFL